MTVTNDCKKKNSVSAADDDYKDERINLSVIALFFVIWLIVLRVIKDQFIILHCYVRNLNVCLLAECVGYAVTLILSIWQEKIDNNLIKEFVR